MDGLLGFYEFEDPSDWPSSFQNLRDIDHLLRCPICKDYFDTAMITSGCAHTFCSLCVRRCLAQETKCPSCRATLTENELRPNRLVDNITKSFRNGRKTLLSSLAPCTTDSKAISKQDGVYCSGEKAASSGNSRKRRRAHVKSLAGSIEDADTGPTSNNGTIVSTDSRAADGNSSCFEVGEHSCGHNSAESDTDFESGSGGMSVKNPRSQRTHTHSSLASQTSETTVICPNCQQMVSQSRINKHLDRCLNGNPECARALTSTTLLKNKKPPAPMLQLKPKRGSSTLARPTKLAYSLLSESKLRRTLKELGIPFKGEKSQMQARHVEWVNMYMANADSETPVSHHILLKRLSAWEESMLRQSEAPRNDTHSQQPRHQRNSLQNLDTSTADHVVKYADSFAQLVEQANKFRPKKRSL